ncbi:hypothetical protein [endosymbiont DhMRE of Dentiscutata heterogama]|uniref:hypothetical protein n=1 Tax=endosymbiont DhMRE of Dentiscutata heterogama TaxID=1609546 RepID=UPI002AD38432|nr:hypothetical protein [endosymbiont DhMRE of Dentiscutata heterogama]
MTMLIYGLGLIIWLITGLTTYWGITSRTTKLVPIPSHVINYSDHQLLKVIQWWLYSPIWHFIAPTYFLVWFFRHERTDLLKKRLKLTILLCFTQPALYFAYCYFRSKLGDREYFKKFNARWTLPFLSSRKMSEKLGVDSDYRSIWKIILVIFWFSLFSLLTYLILRYRKQIKHYLSNKKRALARKKREVYGSRFIGKKKNDRGGVLAGGQRERERR